MDAAAVSEEEVNKGADTPGEGTDVETLKRLLLPTVRKELKAPVIVSITLSTAGQTTLLIAPEILEKLEALYAARAAKAARPAEARERRVERAGSRAAGMAEERAAVAGRKAGAFERKAAKKVEVRRKAWARK